MRSHGPLLKEACLVYKEIECESTMSFHTFWYPQSKKKKRKKRKSRNSIFYLTQDIQNIVVSSWNSHGYYEELLSIVTIVIIFFVVTSLYNLGVLHSFWIDDISNT